MAGVWIELDRWIEIASQAAGGGEVAQRIVKTLASNPDEGGFVTPDAALIAQTFHRDDMGVRDLRSGDSIRPAPILLHDVELWLAAAADVDLRLARQILNRLGGLLSLWAIAGDPLDGKAELRVPKHDDRAVDHRLVTDAAVESSSWSLPVLGDAPSISLPGTGWTRPAGEYIRPSRQLALVSLELAAEEGSPDDFRNLSDRGAYWTRVVGLDHHRQALRDEARGRGLVWLELVPEMSNPYDDTAVAVDLDCVRVGYIAAQVAARLHPAVRYQNLSGYACFVPGVVRTDGRIRAVLPTFSTLRSLIDLALIETELWSLWNALPDDTREAITADRFVLGPETLAGLSRFSSLAPHVDLPPEDDPSARRAHLSTFLAARKHEHDEERAAYRDEQKRATQLRIERDKLERAVRDGKIIDAAADGLSTSQIAAELELASSTVRNVLKRAGVAGDDPSGQNGYAENAQRQRMERCAEALRLQREGLTRAQIAVSLGITTETVKLLLRDGRFYEAPERYEGRLSLAVTAHRDRWTRGSVDTAAERRAINDAHALALTRVDLLD